MELITINPNNEPYYSEDFIKGFKCGAERQFEADKKEINIAFRHGLEEGAAGTLCADRPLGEWIEMYRDGFGNMICMCSKCSFHASRGNYCPNCGARMKGADDEC